MNQDSSPEQHLPRYIIGIDLGTTNCAVAFVDTKNKGRRVADFPVRQFTAPDVSEFRDALPSFLYALTDGERTEADERVHAKYRVGTHAREHGGLTPGRLIASAKSWLCHAGIDRRSALLPWHAADDVSQLSPLEAQAVILNHIRVAWDESHPEAPMVHQEVYITVPASFDEIARELTIEAAKKAGLSALILLEEPQAAFYAWLSHHESSWAEIIQPDDHILVCDVGGGTTDLTLIHARPDASGPVVFHRTAVGDHLILGGDNLDLALAHHLEPKLSPNAKLDPRSWSVLVRRCRFYKESLLSASAPDTIEVVLPGTGSRLLARQRSTTLTRSEVESLLLDGFLPRVALDTTPNKKASGFQEFDLPYAADPAITKYLAEFLRESLPRDTDGRTIPPRAILLNGGLFESPMMRKRFRDVLASWFHDVTGWKPVELDHRRLDLAVARGAAYFGIARRGQGVRVVSNLARSYFLGIETASGSPTAVCVAPARLNTGETITIDQHPLHVRLKTPVEFPLYVSSRRTTDQAGDIVTPDADSFTALPPMRTVLAVSKQATQTTVKANLSAKLTELGTLELAIVEQGGNRSWKLGFDLRAATRTDLSFHDGQGERSGMMDQGQIDQTASLLNTYFSLHKNEVAARSIFKELEKLTGLARKDWPVSYLRAIWQVMMDQADTRRTSAIHEQRWLNVTGYSLRPGFGFTLDDWRVGETWKLFPAGLSYASSEAVCAEWWVFWRRLAGGLTQGQQTALAMPLIAALKSLWAGKPKARVAAGWDVRSGSHDMIELLRLLAVLERLPRPQRITIGEGLITRITGICNEAEQSAAWWAIGRLGSRVPLYNSVQQQIPPEGIAQWVNQLVPHLTQQRDAQFALVSLTRRTDDRYRDVNETTRAEVVKKLTETGAPEHWIKLVEEGGQLDAEEQNQAFGDALPQGLRLG